MIILFSGLSVYAEDFSEGEQTTQTTQAVIDETTTKNSKKEKAKAKKTLKQQKAELKEKLKENEKKLTEFEESAKQTEEYIDALDEKIGYLNEELDLLDAEVTESQGKIDELTKQIKPIKKELKQLKKRYNKAKKDYEELNESFDTTYNAYCLRLRAMYISGHSSVIEALLSCDDLAQFVNRFEMIRVVAKSDTQLLKEVNKKIKLIVSEKDGLNEKKKGVEKTEKELSTKQNALKKEQEELVSKQNEIADKKITLAQDRAESDRLFAEYSHKMQIYTEFRNEDEEIIAKVDQEIDDLLSGLKDPSEITTAQSPEHDESKVTGEYSGDGELFSRNNAALSLTYPVPGHYAVSQGYGHYRNGRAHTGIDYPCPTGSKVVAAQKGIVITVKRLNYSYGYYVMIYHGTDAKGRKIVTLYAHNSSILVSVGQSVRKGTQIAKSGSTGNSTGPHCHFELIIDGSKVNPKNYLSK